MMLQRATPVSGVAHFQMALQINMAEHGNVYAYGAVTYRDVSREALLPQAKLKGCLHVAQLMRN